MLMRLVAFGLRNPSEDRFHKLFVVYYEITLKTLK